MKKFTLLIAALFVWPAFSIELANTQIPNSADWYVHVNLEQMRNGQAGQALYAWFEDEVIEEIEEEIDIRVDDIVYGITAYGSGAHGHGSHENTLVSLNGDFSSRSQERILDAFRKHVDVSSFDLGGYTVYQAAPDKGDDEIYVTFVDDNRAIVAASRAQLENSLNNQFSLPADQDNALLIVRAENPLILGGVDTDSAHDGGPWDSSVFRNISQIAVGVSDLSGNLQIQAILETPKPEMAQAIQNLAQGFLALGVLNDEEPELAALLQQIDIQTSGSQVNVELIADPVDLVDFLD